MKQSFADARSRQVDESLRITDLLTRKDAPFDLVVGELAGDHGKRINHVSDRVYFVIEGEGTATVGDDSYQIKALDLVYIPKNTVHGICGKLKFAIITAPPLSKGDEERIR
jgi:mannose-6-phosphate isomerase-like protein (cupin superfamily)